MLINRISRFVRNPFFITAFLLWIMFFVFGQRFLGQHASDEDLTNSHHSLDLRKHWLIRGQLHPGDAPESGPGEAARPVEEALPGGAGRPVRVPRAGGSALQQVNGAPGSRCRNSRQGVTLLVDEQGFVCKRANLHPNGCCPSDARMRHRYMCSSCNRNNCCQVYEYCVACCLHPNKRDLLHRALRSAVDAVPAGGGHKVLLVSLSDQFELCLAKCRTSSSSVHHENQYRDAAAKFCYGPAPPMLVTTVD